jgi:hypothetical protein
MRLNRAKKTTILMIPMGFLSSKNDFAFVVYPLMLTAATAFLYMDILLKGTVS